jgi:solute carrier family 25 carnitine/acylcarnitine transporter 20/29
MPVGYPAVAYSPRARFSAGAPANGGFAASAAEPPSALNATLLKSAKDVFAGTMGGVTVTLLGHPFDTVKVLLQTQPANNPIYNGPFDAVRKVVASEGFKGLYKGVTSPLAGQMFFRATLFFGYARAKEIVGVSPDDPLSYCKAGALAWLAGSLFESPIDLYKSQWQMQIIKAKQTANYVPEFKTVGECVKASIKHSGIRGPFQGFGATLTRNLPAGAIYFGVFENAKNHFAAQNESGVATDIQIMASGGLGGFMYWSLFYPIDCIRSALLTDSIDPSKRKYKGFTDAASQLMKQGGVKRLYAGLVPCLLRASPANAGMLYTVDKIKQMLGSS